MRAGGHRHGRMPYLLRLQDVSIEGYILPRLNAMVANGEALHAHVRGRDEAVRLFGACVAGLAGAGSAGWVVTELQREMTATLAAFAAAGLIARGTWSQHAAGLVRAALSVMAATLRAQCQPVDAARGAAGAAGASEGGGLCGWLVLLLRVVAPAVSCETGARELTLDASLARVLVEAAVAGGREGGKAGAEVVAGSLHVLACALVVCINTDHELVRVVCACRH